MLALSVARMRQAGEDHLKRALATNGQQPLGVAEQQGRTLVIRHAARKANERNVKSQGDVQHGPERPGPFRPTTTQRVAPLPSQPPTANQFWWTAATEEERPAE